MEPSFLSLYSLLGCLEEILQVLNRDDSKSTSSGCFSILLISNLFILKACVLFFFFKKKGELKGCRGLLFYNFQISYVCLTDVSVSDAFIHFPLYN
jgi:hypothetical protein